MNEAERAKIEAEIAQLEAEMAPLKQRLDAEDAPDALSPDGRKLSDEYFQRRGMADRLRVQISTPYPARQSGMTDRDWLETLELRTVPGAPGYTEAEGEWIRQQCAEFVASNPPSALRVQFELLEKSFESGKDKA